MPSKYRLKKLAKPSARSLEKARIIYTEVKELDDRLRKSVRKANKKIPEERRINYKDITEFSSRNIKYVERRANKPEEIFNRFRPVNNDQIIGDNTQFEELSAEEIPEEFYPDYDETILQNFVESMRLIFSHNMRLFEYIMGWYQSALNEVGGKRLARALDQSKAAGLWPNWEDISDTTRLAGKLTEITRIFSGEEAEVKDFYDELTNEESYDYNEKT